MKCTAALNLRFNGIPEVDKEENTEAILEAFLEKELNVEILNTLTLKEFTASAKRIET